MHLRGKWACAAATLAVAALLALGPPARADFVLILNDGKGNTAYYDMTTGSGSSTGTASVAFGGSLASGKITADGSIGNFSFTFDALSTKQGPGNLASLDLSFNVERNGSNGTDTLTITGYQTGYSLPNGPAVVTGAVGGTLDTSSDSITVHGWFDGSNTGNSSSPPAFTTPSGSVDAFGPGGFTTTGPGSFSDPKATVNITGPFSLIDQVVITLNGGDAATGDLKTQIYTPEPASLALWLSGLPVLGLVRYWRRRQRGGPLAVA
jgi:hypothetical protein